MAKVDVLMPQMGESIAEGTITKWLKAEGDEVKRDESILEISTDKVDADIPSPVEGVLVEILARESETVEVGSVVARIETEAGAAQAADEVEGRDESETRDESEARDEVEKRDEVERRQTGEPHEEAAAPAEVPAVAEVSPAVSREVEREGDGAPPHETRDERLRTRSTPLVRRIAAEHGIDLGGLSGSGIAGRVTKKDILAYIDQRGAGPAPAPSSAAGLLNVPIHGETLEIRIPAVVIRDTDRIEEMSVMRQRIMEHMLMSRRISAHVSSVFEIDFERVSAVRARLKPRFEQDGVKLTYLPFIIRAVIEGLKSYPVLNASVVGRKIVYHNHYNIGIAVAMDEGSGLIVPVLKNTDELSLLGIGRRVFELADRARRRQLDPDDVQGGTFTITNPGVFGSLFGTPIINQPQVAILGIGAIEKRPVVIDDMIAVRRRAYFGLSFDHRVVDGAMADFFMARVKDVLEKFPDDA